MTGPQLALELHLEPPRKKLQDFDGATYEPKRDKVRLNRQLDKVQELMQRGQWVTLTYLCLHTQATFRRTRYRAQACGVGIV